ncbi:CHASE4 domain-containing protein [Pararhizobium qamdonense]|uniref:CHASE4 domain-containing protein n=1 Tax=Pararhizobium qamdonense TaxID=3031126 RepID=UPI0023E1CFB4|nr:CHASE4 domain-containing protein [Pararhizobium qamdonense]
MADSIGNITAKSDSIDDARAVSAAASAVGTMKKQLEGTIRDNAFWDDAFDQVNSDNRDDWIIENWGTTTKVPRSSIKRRYPTKYVFSDT